MDFPVMPPLHDDHDDLNDSLDDMGDEDINALLNDIIVTEKDWTKKSYDLRIFPHTRSGASIRRLRPMRSLHYEGFQRLQEPPFLGLEKVFVTHQTLVGYDLQSGGRMVDALHTIHKRQCRGIGKGYVV